MRRLSDKYRASLSLVSSDTRDCSEDCLLSTARLLALNKDVDLLYPIVNGRRLSDLEAVQRGFVPENLQNMARSYWHSAPSAVDNSSLSDEQIVQQARFSSLALESSERSALASQIIDSRLAAAASAAVASPTVETSQSTD